MPTYLSPEAGEIVAPDGYTAAHWLVHRLAHQRYGERAIFRELQIWPLDYDADHWTASAWIGAPRPGAGALDFAGIYVYAYDDFLFDIEWGAIE